MWSLTTKSISTKRFQLLPIFANNRFPHSVRLVLARNTETMSASIVLVGDGLSIETATGIVSVQKTGTLTDTISGYAIVTGIALDLGTDVPALLSTGKLPEPGTDAADLMHNGKFVYDVELLAQSAESTGRHRRRVTETRGSGAVFQRLSLGWAAVDSACIRDEEKRLGNTLDSWAFDVVEQRLLHQASQDDRASGVASAAAASASSSVAPSSSTRSRPSSSRDAARPQPCGCTDGRCTDLCCTADLPVSALEDYSIGRRARRGDLLGVELDAHGRSISYMIRGHTIGTAFRRIGHDARRGAGKRLIPVVSFTLAVKGSEAIPVFRMSIGGPEDVAAPLVKTKRDVPIGIGWLPHQELVALEHRRIKEAAAAAADAEAAAAAAGDDAAVPPAAAVDPPRAADAAGDAALAAALAAEAAASTEGLAAAAAAAAAASAAAPGASGGAVASLDAAASSAEPEEESTRVAFVETADDKAPEPDLNDLERATAAQLWADVQNSSEGDAATARKMGETIFFFLGGNTEVLRGRLHPIEDETEVTVSRSRRGESMFHTAAATGKIETARFLMNMSPGGVDVNARAKGGDRGTPLHRAIEEGKADFVAFLLGPIAGPSGEQSARPSLELPNVSGVTPVQLAVQLRNPAVLAQLRAAGVEVQEQSEGNNNGVHLACASLDLPALEAALAASDDDAVVAKNDSGERPADILLGHARTAVVAPLLTALLKKHGKALDHLRHRDRPLIFSLLSADVKRSASDSRWDVARGKFSEEPELSNAGKTIRFRDSSSIVPLSRSVGAGATMRVCIKIAHEAHKDETCVMGFVRNCVLSAGYSSHPEDHLFFRPYNGDIKGTGNGEVQMKKLDPAHMGDSVVMELHAGKPGSRSGTLRIQLPGKAMRTVISGMTCSAGDQWYPAVGCYSARKQILELVSVSSGSTSALGPSGADSGIMGGLSRDDELVRRQMEQAFGPALLPAASTLGGVGSARSLCAAASVAAAGSADADDASLSAAASEAASAPSLTGLASGDPAVALAPAPSVSLVESLEGVDGCTATDTDMEGRTLLHALVGSGLLKERDSAALKRRGMSPFVPDGKGVLPVRLAAGGTLAETVQLLHGVVVTGVAVVRSDRERAIDATFTAIRFAPTAAASGSGAAEVDTDSDSSDDEDTRRRRRERRAGKLSSAGSAKLARTWHTKLLQVFVDGKMHHIRYRQHPAPALGSKIKSGAIVVPGPHWDGEISDSRRLAKVEDDYVVVPGGLVVLQWPDDTQSAHPYTPDVQAVTVIDMDEMTDDEFKFPEMAMVSDFELKYRKRPETYDARLFASGLFVRRGSTWKWSDQDASGIGWVTGKSETKTRRGEPAWITVKWLDGKTNSYRIGGKEHLTDIGVIDVDPVCDAAPLVATAAGISLADMRGYSECKLRCYTPEGRSIIESLEEASTVPLGSEPSATTDGAAAASSSSSSSSSSGAAEASADDCIGRFVLPGDDDDPSTGSAAPAKSGDRILTRAELEALPLTSDGEGDVSLYSLVAKHDLSGSLPASQETLVSLILDAQSRKSAAATSPTASAEGTSAAGAAIPAAVSGGSADASAATSEYGERTMAAELRFDPALVRGCKDLSVSADGTSVTSKTSASQAILARVPLYGGKRYKVAFQLVKDTKSQTVCFGFGLPGAVDNSYSSEGSSHWTLRAYNGDLNGPGKSTSTQKIKVQQGDVVTFEVDLRPGHGTMSFETRGETFRGCFSSLPTSPSVFLLPCLQYYGSDRTAKLLTAVELMQDTHEHRFELRSAKGMGCSACTTCGLPLISPDVWVDMSEWAAATAKARGERLRFLATARSLVSLGSPAIVEPDDKTPTLPTSKSSTEGSAGGAGKVVDASTSDGTMVRLLDVREDALQVQVAFFGDSPAVPAGASAAASGSAADGDAGAAQWVDASRVRLLEPRFGTDRLYTPPVILSSPAALCPTCFRADGRDLCVQPYESSLVLGSSEGVISKLSGTATGASVSSTASTEEGAALEAVENPADAAASCVALRTALTSAAVDGSTLLHDCALCGRLAWLHVAVSVCGVNAALWGTGSGVPTPLEIAVGQVPVIDPAMGRGAEDAPIEVYSSDDDEDEELVTVKRLLRAVNVLGKTRARTRIVALGMLDGDPDGEDDIMDSAGLRITRSKSRRGSGSALVPGALRPSLSRVSSRGSEGVAVGDGRTSEDGMSLPVNTASLYGLVVLEERSDSSGSSSADTDGCPRFDVAAYAARRAKAGAVQADRPTAASGAGGAGGAGDEVESKLICGWVQLACFADSWASEDMAAPALKTAILSSDAWHAKQGRDVSGAPVSPAVDTAMMLLELADPETSDDAVAAAAAKTDCSSKLLHSAVLLQLDCRIGRLRHLGARLEDSADAQGRSPLHVVCAAPAPSLAMVSRLLDLGASTLVRDSSGALPLHYAARCTNPLIGSELVDVILDQMREELRASLQATKAAGAGTAVAGAEGEGGRSSGDDGEGSEVDEAEVENRLLLEADSFDSRGRRPLHNACRAGNLDTVTTLVDMGCQVDHPDDAWPPFHDAVRYGRRNVVRLLPSFGLDINKCNRRSGNTALHLAVQRRSRGLVDMLLEHEARPNCVNSDGLTPMDLARQMRAHDVLGLLHEALEEGVKANSSSGTSAAAELASVVGDRLIDPQHVSLSRRIGEGGFGVVMEATLKERPGTLVVVKQLKTVTALDGEHREMLLQEVKTMQLACSTHHPAVLQFIGLVAQDNGMSGNGKPLAYGLVLEHAAGGSLRDLLDSDDVLEDLPLLRRLKLLADVASGLAFLHMPQKSRPPIAHRDLKPDNILLDITRTRAMISDFGLSKVRDVAQKATKTSKFATTMQYRAPEAWVSRRKAAAAAAAAAGSTARGGGLAASPPPRGGAGDASVPLAVRQVLAQDVFSLGVMIWETVSLLPPFYGATDIRDVHEDIVVNKLLPGPVEAVIAPEIAGISAADDPALTAEQAAAADVVMNAEADELGLRDESTRDIVDLDWFDTAAGQKGQQSASGGQDTQPATSAEPDAAELNQTPSRTPDMDFGHIAGFEQFQGDEDYEPVEVELWLAAARAMPRSLAELIARCCAYEPFDRPGSDDVAAELCRIRDVVAKQIRERGRKESNPAHSDTKLAHALDDEQQEQQQQRAPSGTSGDYRDFEV